VVQLLICELTDEFEFRTQGRKQPPDGEKDLIFPNPFRDRVNIQFIPATSERAVVSIFNITGALVETLLDGMVEEGQEYKLEFVPGQNNNQVLIYRITVGDHTQTGRIMQQR
jgi:hypothetical protein